MKQCAVPRDVRVGCVTTDFAMQVGGVGICWPGAQCHLLRTVVLGGWGWDVWNCYIMLLFPGSRNLPMLFGNLPFCLEVGES